MNIHFGGIDPGINGGICIIDQTGKLVDKSIMPTKIKPNGKRHIDIVLVNSFFLGIEYITYEVASAMPGQGVSSMFNYGRDFGRILGWIEVNEKLSYGVIPRIWKKHYGIEKDKKFSAEAACRLAKDNFLATDRSRIPHSGMTEAYLIALYGKIVNKFK